MALWLDPFFAREYITDDGVILYLMNKMWGNIIKVMCYYLSGLTRRRANQLRYNRTKTYQTV